MALPPPGSRAAWGGRAVAEARALLAARTTWPTTCGRCQHPVHQWQRWDIGHIRSRTTHPHLTWDPRNWRIEHARCNRSAGAVSGNTTRTWPKVDAITTTWDGTSAPPTIPSTGRVVVIVCGPPGAGKTSWSAASGLRVLDIDDPQWQGREALLRRSIRALASDPAARAAVVRSGARSRSRARWAALARATHVLVFEVPAETCRRRVIARARPRPPIPRQLAAVSDWWARHDADAHMWTATGW